MPLLLYTAVVFWLALKWMPMRINHMPSILDTHRLFDGAVYWRAYFEFTCYSCYCIHLLLQ